MLNILLVLIAMSAKSNEVILNIRIDRELRDAFLAACKSRDTTVSRELRDHARKYVARHSQKELFK